jgi:DNA-binding response OmpR family regulator
MAEQKPNILVVDDEEPVGQVLKAGLELHGFAVRVETRSTDTIKACLEFHPDLILLDVDMPVKDGGQVASELRSHPTLQHIPVMLLTSLASRKRTGTRSSSGEMVLSKEISIAELVARIRAMLRPQAPR